MSSVIRTAAAPRPRPRRSRPRRSPRRRDPRRHRSELDDDGAGLAEALGAEEPERRQGQPCGASRRRRRAFISTNHRTGGGSRQAGGVGSNSMRLIAVAGRARRGSSARSLPPPPARNRLRRLGRAARPRDAGVDDRLVVAAWLPPCRLGTSARYGHLPRFDATAQRGRLVVHVAGGQRGPRACSAAVPGGLRDPPGPARRRFGADDRASMRHDNTLRSTAGTWGDDYVVPARLRADLDFNPVENPSSRLLRPAAPGLGGSSIGRTCGRGWPAARRGRACVPPDGVGWNWSRQGWQHAICQRARMQAGGPTAAMRSG